MFTSPMHVFVACFSWCLPFLGSTVKQGPGDSVSLMRAEQKHIESSGEKRGQESLLFDELFGFDAYMDQVRSLDCTVDECDEIVDYATYKASAANMLKQPVQRRSFDYSSVWDRPAGSAEVEQADSPDGSRQGMLGNKREAIHEDSCSVKVYVYTISGPCNDTVSSTMNDVFGMQVGWVPWLRNTDQHMMAEILRYRFLSSPCRTLNPDEADIFFVPALTKAKSVKEWQAACNRCTIDELRPQLTHLNEQTARQHMFAVSSAHAAAANCKGWFSNPIGLFEQAVRLANSGTVPQGAINEMLYYPGYHAANLPRQAYPSKSNGSAWFDVHGFPNLHAMPMASMVHWSKEFSERPPWLRQERKTLMLFVGSDLHGDMKVRQRIRHQCREYNDQSVCRYTKFQPAHVYLKSEATFCLDPAGDWPIRRSITDSIVMGCIPVLFNSATELASKGILWDSWRDDSRIMVPRQSFINGEIDLRDLLTSIPQHRVHHMQRTVRGHAKTWQSSLHEDPGDFVSTLLTKIADITE